tara:strand:+ start:245 stop:823 length:579 start_codon:yes stop_codon:yes gene_type:complete
MKKLIVILTLVLFINNSKAEMKLLFKPFSTEWPNIILILSDHGKLAPVIKDIYEKDPFNRPENDKYKYTSLSCRHTMYITSEKGKVAFKNPFTTVIGLRFISQSREIVMQGNYGMSLRNKVLHQGMLERIDFVSLSSKEFSSRQFAENAITNGYCDLKSTTRVEPSGVGGEIMYDHENKWRQLSKNFVVIKT